MSAISLSSQDEAQSFAILAETETRGRPAPTSPFLQSNAPTRMSLQNDESEPTLRVNNGSAKKPPLPSFQRSRTYSQPYLSDLPNGKTRLKSSGYKSTSPRPADVKPTRIPKPSHIPNGSLYQYNPTNYPYQSPEVHAAPETRSINSSRSNIALPNRQNPHLLNETPPFKPESMSSHHGHEQYDQSHDPPGRASIDSVERPFEHWYRGEVSRNGGVGELRVGRRQEMLEIANYGHTLRAKAARTQNILDGAQEERQGMRHNRKRAGSVSGIDAKRGSLYLNDEDANQVKRVLDEDPPTDLDGEGVYASDLGSASGHYMPSEAQRGYDFVGDLSTVSAPMYNYDPYERERESRSATPTSSSQHRSSSRQQSGPPTRIPGPPRQSQSSESRGPTPTPTHISRGSSEPPPAPSTSKTPSPPPVRQRQPSKPSKPTPTTAKRGASPAATPTPKKSRTAASKATRAKTLASRKELEAEAKRRSVAYYPTPAEEDMSMDAIPSWTQPVPRQGNWDEVHFLCFFNGKSTENLICVQVVLPVVARKKGLDGHYEHADGNSQPRKRQSAIEPV